MDAEIDNKPVELIIDEVLADPELIDARDENPDLRELIVDEWQLDPSVYSILIGHGVTVAYLADIDEAALADIFSVVKWTGHKHALRRKLQLWEESALYQRDRANNTSSDCSNQAGPSTQLSSRASQHPLLSTSVTLSLLEDILERNEKGKIVTQFYEMHQRLDTHHRKHLAHTIVDYYIANEKYFPIPDMTRFARCIAEKFPPELPEVYFNPRDASINKKHPSGILYDRFHNRNKKYSIQSKQEKKKPIDNWKLFKVKALVLSQEEIKRQSSFKTWLRNNQHPTEKVADLWRESFLLRMREIVAETDSNKTHLVAEWPRLTDENGYLLIDADFETIYRYVTTSNIFDDWEAFVSRFMEYIELNGLKDDYSRQLLTHLEAESVARDTRDFICCTIFHGIVKPVRTSSRKLPTILQAQTEMCYACATEDEFSEAVDSLRNELLSDDVPFGPRIFVVGRTDKLTGFYVVTSKLQYKLPTFLRCVDLVLKLKFVLNYDFPESCELFWCFIAKQFYNIDFSRKAKNSQLLQLLAHLRDKKATA
nr:uncharacterized protein LOC115265764 [Aedes albopictus]